MTDSNIEGHDAGIRLWNLMASSQDASEQEYFNRLNSIISETGKAWFTDTITQRDAKRNQASWFITWDASKSKWNVSLFLVPEGAKEVNDRLLPEIKLEDLGWQDIDPNDLIVE